MYLQKPVQKSESGKIISVVIVDEPTSTDFELFAFTGFNVFAVMFQSYYSGELPNSVPGCLHPNPN